MKKLARMCVGVLLTGLVLGLTPARTRAEEKPPVKAPEGQLTFSSLKALLDLLGYDDIVENKSDKGEVVSYTVKTERDNWRFSVNVWPSPDGNLAFSAWLGKLPDPGKAPPKVLLSILQANDYIYPLTFTYSEKWTQFLLFGKIPNKNVQAKDVRKMIEKLTSAVKEYEPLWNADKWPDNKPK